MTRPYVSVVVNFLGQRVTDPRPSDWSAATRVLRYVKGAPDFVPKFRAGGNVLLEAYADADLGTDANLKTISGWLVSVGPSVVACFCRKHKSVSLSTAEAELIAQSEAMKELRWLCLVMEGLKFEQDGPSVLFGENYAAMAWTLGEVSIRAAKQIDMREHFEREAFEKKEVLFKHKPSSENNADVLTKSLPASEFRRQRYRFSLSSQSIGVMDMAGPTASQGSGHL